MALPQRTINVTDLLIERPTLGGYGDDETAREVLFQGLCAVAERKSDLIRTPQNVEVTITADVLVEPEITGVQEGDLLTWTDFNGTVSDAEAIVVEPWSLGPKNSHIRIRVGSR
ncbi:MAG: hypothetical protein GY778_28845 [bacterium]|nr:hypothetical protein [bacterium]